MEIEVTKVWLENERIFIQTTSGEIKSHPLNWFPNLNNAPKSALEKFTLSPFGIHWEDIDEDLSFEGFFHYTGPSIFEKR
ncbi:DUF2442 domain-containing protein [Pedobacter endophyticus]|uniref:DUF2442 domain-containing protein n=1 Tax=Pedobacter endophyticus TaxID=2789740 RepID=A0A7U3Q3J4_9SPHI|nr:DUF2442 domain-containing protein [Pedobacter endophyticus]QPH37694.1 DUF2442 domain-containing protein [Pedobacter endophyticus]